MERIDLAGVWRIRRDALSQGLTERWWRNAPAEGWEEIGVPSAWQSVLGADANGVAWYRRELPREAVEWARAGRRVLLRFESVATDCRAWVGGVEVGRHMGDWVPFEFEVAAALRREEGPAELIVRVDQVHAPRPPKGVVIENGHVTKGFHDVLSMQHAGIWGGVSVRAGGAAAVVPNGVFVDADPRERRVAVAAELDGVLSGGAPTFELRDPEGGTAARGELAVEGPSARGSAGIERAVALWSPESPRLYTLSVKLPEGEELTQRVGFRTVETGGAGNSLVLLNGRPIYLRGLLDWGHQPKWIAPAPPREQVRAELLAAKERGFNCWCLCMFYPPEHFFELADELGVLVWQEHPVWKSRMTPDVMPEYRRMYEQFLRRDRRHASVVIVSATCEHDSWDEGLGKWWWETSGKMLPRTLRQVQTGFLEWTPPEQTDLYDDHVYDTCGRWVRFVGDMSARIGELPPKPFVMGETIISNAWPDVEGLRGVIEKEGAASRAGAALPLKPPVAQPDAPWWMTHGLEECAALERDVTRRLGEATLARFKEQGEWFAKQHRKFQGEVLRTMERSAGFVTNSIRDVPICRLGMMDDLDRWRWSAEELRPWLRDRVLLLRTPGHLRGFAGGPVTCEIGVSNFGQGPHRSAARVECAGERVELAEIASGEGSLNWNPFELGLPEPKGVARVVEISAVSGELKNAWPLVLVPKQEGDAFAGAARLGGWPLTEKERAPEFEERAYSSGWGLPCRTWRPRRQEPEALAPEMPALGRDVDVPPECAVALTHRLTGPIRRHLERGGRAVLLAGPQAGGIGSRWINTWGLLPLVVEREDRAWPVRSGESAAVVALLLHDLTAGTCRAVPVEEMGLVDHVEPVIRYVWTHDSGVPMLFDAVFAARVGGGVLVASTLDHTTAAGAWMLRRLVRFARDAELKPAERELDVARFVAA